ncbi:MAG TPA: DUF72 domain-containing protein [Caulobacteraceae bacterium]|nr:DUF72 domain-containing protein [Caulobacteraceae bacterium]
MPRPEPFVGTAGWTVPRTVRDRFPAGGSGLERYAGALRAVEINSTFYRPHRPETFVRWRESTPPHFRFSVKLPRALTHEARLQGCEAGLDAFLRELGGLEDKLGPLLVQLPPSLVFDAAVAGDFFGALRRRTAGPVVCEPRHASWFAGDGDALLARHRIARAAADPARSPAARSPGGWPGLAYWRLHGSPRMYYSAYAEPELAALARAIAANPAGERWCIFDNTASGAAAANGLALKDILDRAPA